tara:strand:- start:5213 stop:5512 length:300 start_codon:yes stop_codon:yes gene_type:complete
MCTFAKDSTHKDSLEHPNIWSHSVKNNKNRRRIVKDEHNTVAGEYIAPRLQLRRQRASRVVKLGMREEGTTCSAPVGWNFLHCCCTRGGGRASDETVPK